MMIIIWFQWQDIHWEGDYSGSNIQTNLDSDHIQELRNASSFNENEVRSLLESFFETNLSEAKACNKKIKAFLELQYIES